MKKKVSIIITAFKEPNTVANLIEQIESQVEKLSKTCIFQIILACPDIETKAAAQNKDKLRIVLWIKDPGKGKPTALNLAFKKVIGEILVLTDGDVSWSDSALELMIEPFEDCSVGLVSARPISLNKQNNLFGFWAWVLTEAGAHQERLLRQKQAKFIDASGYLMALRSNLVKKIPYDILSDDAFISREVFNQGKRIVYQDRAKVYIKYPNNLSDWLKQKKRSTGGYIQLDQIKKRAKAEKMRSFVKETKSVFRIFQYAKSPKEFIWLFLLIFARLYLWLAIFYERRIIKKPFSKTWVRIESTK